MTRRPPISNSPDPLFPDTTPFRSLLDIVDRHVERLRERLLREPRRHPDAHPAKREFEQSIAPVGVKPVEERRDDRRSEEHTSELQSIMRISYAVFCLTTNKSMKE